MNRCPACDQEIANQVCATSGCLLRGWKLRPCPFCGEDPMIGDGPGTWEEGDIPDIGCPSGDCIYVSAEKGSFALNIRAWNRRDG